MGQSAKYLAYPPITIGDEERLAGVEDRNKFWKDLIPVFQREGSEAGMDAWRKKVNSAIRRRVKAGELTLLYRGAPARRVRK